MENLVSLNTVSEALLALLALLLLVTLAVIIERWHFFRRALRSGNSLEDELRTSDSDTLDELARRHDSSVAAAIIAPAHALRGKDTKTIEGYLTEAMQSQFPVLDRNMWVLDTAVTLGPLIGLLGTIVGMISTFNIFGTQGAGGSEAIVAGGIGHALVATGAGLTVAIIGLVFLNYFNKCIRLGVHQMELVRTMTANRLNENISIGLTAPVSPGVMNDQQSPVPAGSAA